MKRMWILPDITDIYNSSMTQISLKSAVQNSIWHTASTRAPGHASLEGINGTLGQLGHFDARNHLLEPHGCTTWFTWPSTWIIASFWRNPTRNIEKWSAGTASDLLQMRPNWKCISDVLEKKKNVSSVEGPLFNFHAMQNICQILSDGCEKLLFQR